MLLHERWFVDIPGPVIDWDGVTAPGALIAVGAAVLTLVGLRIVWRATGRAQLIPGPAALGADERHLARLYALAPLILGIHIAVPLVVNGIQRHLFVPNLELGGGGAVPIGTAFGALAALLQIGIGLALLYGAFTRAAAVLLVILWVAGVVYFGPTLLLEQTIYLGIAATLYITGRGPFSIDALLAPGLARPHRRWLPHAMTILRIGTGVSLAVVAFTEKLWNQPLALAFLEQYPINFTGALGVPLSDETFIYAAGAVELTAGLLLVTNTYVRLGIVVLWFPFNLTLALFGWRELVGHLPIYGAMALLAVWGPGNEADVRAFHQGLAARRESSSP